MATLKIAIVVLAAMLASPAAALTMEEAFAQCRARYAHMPEMPGSGDPVKAATVEGCARESDYPESAVPRVVSLGVVQHDEPTRPHLVAAK